MENATLQLQDEEPDYHLQALILTNRSFSGKI